MWERGDKTNRGIPELNASSVGMAKVSIQLRFNAIFMIKYFEQVQMKAEWKMVNQTPEHQNVLSSRNKGMNNGFNRTSSFSNVTEVQRFQALISLD